jgi:hypothetical protein
VPSTPYYGRGLSTPNESETYIGYAVTVKFDGDAPAVNDAAKTVWLE